MTTRNLTQAHGADIANGIPSGEVCGYRPNNRVAEIYIKA